MREKSGIGTYVRIASDVLSRTVHGDEVILDLNGGVYFGLNRTGTVVWEKLKQGCSPSQIVAALTDQFYVDPETARKDVSNLLSQLKKQGLIEVA